MKPIDYLQKVYSRGSFNFQFSKVHVFNGTSRIGSFDGQTCLRKIPPTYGGGAMTIFEYDEVLEDIQKLGAMRDFSAGIYHFLASWSGHSDNAIIHVDNDTIEALTLTAIDGPGKTDIALTISVPPYNIIFSDCNNICFD